MSAPVRPETGNHVRLAVGLLNAVEWDRENGTGEAQELYLSECDEPIDDLIRGLVIVARTGLENVADNSRGRHSVRSLLQGMAARSVAWQ